MSPENQEDLIHGQIVPDKPKMECKMVHIHPARIILWKKTHNYKVIWLINICLKLLILPNSSMVKEVL